MRAVCGPVQALAEQRSGNHTSGIAQLFMPVANQFLVQGRPLNLRCGIRLLPRLL